jgi:hypothetical protein
MRKIFLLAAIVICTNIQAQVKEGQVKYKVELTGGIPGEQDMGALLGDTYMTIYFKNDRSLTEMVTPLYSMKTLTDSKGTITLMDGGGQKSFSRKTKEESERPKPKGSEPQVFVTKEKKKIMGYDCTKALVTMKNSKGDPATTTIWFTEKIQSTITAGLINMDALAKLKGMPLQVEVNQGPVHSKMTAVEVSVKPVPDAVFILSTTGYSEKKMRAPGKQ